jgi:uncharacterized membrane protein YdbT with pleckstrin-like domain
MATYVDQVLLPGERIAWRARYHWITYFWPIFWTPITLGFGIVVTLPWMLAVWINQRSTDLVATDRRLIHKTGLVSRKVTESRLGKIETINVDQSMLGRVLGYGTGSVTGTGVSAVGFPRIADPLGFKRAIEMAAEQAGDERDAA